MPNLNFVGKDKVVNHHQQISFRFLEKVYGDSENMIIHGDNLLALKSLCAEYRNRIKCIYIDPPYNTGNENWIYNDNVNDPQIKSWIGKVVGDEETDLNRHDKWLCMMYPRLKLMRELLSDDGVIFISIDDNEVANLKLICDEIFGRNNFISQFSWKRKKEISNDSRNVSTQGEYILCYGKSLKTELNSESLSDEYVQKSYRPPTKEFPLGYWRPVPITVSIGLNGGGYEYEVETPSGLKQKKIWTYPQHRFEELRANNRIYFGKNGDAIPQRVMYLSESKGKPVSNFWDDVATNKEGKKEILSIFGKETFQTPKPTRLIQKILRLATDPDSIILDAFAGSGTTAHATLEINSEDGGNRKFILIESMEYCESITAERVRRVGGDFSFYELGDPIFEGEDLNPNISRDLLRRYLFYSETKKEIPLQASEDQNLLGIWNGISYHLIDGTLDFKTLMQIQNGSDSYVIFAEACSISQKTLDQFKTIFRKIPRDILRI